jgi:hypothetical protein
MAAMGDTDRADVTAESQRTLSARREAMALSKADLRAAINAADDWVDSNKVSFNNALPAAAQAGLTNAQKAELLVWVVSKRWELGL